jgi:hypothetical protein
MDSNLSAARLQPAPLIPDPSRSCGTCRFWLEAPRGMAAMSDLRAARVGLCMFNPPAMVFCGLIKSDRPGPGGALGQMVPQIQPYRPTTTNEEWCGRFADRVA